MKTVTTVALTAALMIPSPVVCQARQTPGIGLHAAALQGDVETVRRHIDARSDLNQRDPWGSTPLIVAATFGRTEVARVLIDAGADLDLPNSDGSTPLHVSSFLCRAAIVEALLHAGANRYLRDHFSNTPLDAVSAPFDDVKGIYDTLARGLRPLGLELDFDRIRTTRPVIAEMLRPEPADLDAVGFAPVPGPDWRVSTPAEHGIDPMLVAELYAEATGMETLYGLLVIKNGQLIAEGYFRDGSIGQRTLVQSVTKSVTSTLVGIALDRGCLRSVDQRMLEFFPELAGRIADSRKETITIRQLLQMRGGYPWEETDPALWQAMLSGDLLPPMADFPLVADPGTAFHYSNLTSHWLGLIVSRACESDLEGFAREHLFSPLDVEIGDWMRDAAAFTLGHAGLHLTARDMAKFGQLYLDDGFYRERRIVSADWVEESLRRSSEDITSGGIEAGSVGRYFRHVGYGYQWWSAAVGNHRVDFAWGHGGQLIVLVDALDLIVVVTSDPFLLQHDERSWRHERANLNLVGKFIRALPTP